MGSRCCGCLNSAEKINTGIREMKKLMATALIALCLAGFAGIIQSVNCAEKSGKTATADFEYQTKDKFLVKSKLTYPAQKKAVYPLVVMLHSLGYSSSYWGSVATKFNEAGFAVLAIDLKGHGKSTNDIYFRQKSWIYLTNSSYELIPKEVVEILKQVKTEKKDISLENMVFVGADLGANAAIIAAQLQPAHQRPKCMVLISPSMSFKGLYTPVSMADAGEIPILAIASAADGYSKKQVYEMRKYAQGEYTVKLYPSGGMGMIMLKTNPTMPSDIVNWAVAEFNKK